MDNIHLHQAQLLMPQPQLDCHPSLMIYDGHLTQEEEWIILAVLRISYFQLVPVQTFPLL